MLKMPIVVKGAGLEREAYQRLVETLREVPFLREASTQRKRTKGDFRIDFVVSLRGAGIDRRLVCEVKSSGQPRVAREACLSLADYASSEGRNYPIFIAPYISPAAASICEDYGVGYLDLAGNCRLAFDKVYIRREGFPNPVVQKRDLRSLYSPKAESVLRVLLAAGKRTWRTQELSDEACVSLGQVANVKKLLADREWIDTQPDGFSLRSLDKAVLPLLQEWTENYRSARNSATDFYSLKPIPQIEADLSQAAKKLKMPVAFTGFSGAARLAPLAPTVRYQRVSAYAVGDIAVLADRIGMKQVRSGANVTILNPYDEGVLYGTRDIEGAPIVSPIQLYLDLSQMKGRGEEAASAILEGVIKSQWR
jgi:hypothetical protein